MTQIVIERGRTITLPVKVSYDVSEDTITSDIRVSRNSSSLLIAHWMVSYRTDGKDGELLFVLDDSVTANIAEHFGYMDIKRVTGGEPVGMVDTPMEVIIRDVITP